MHHEKLNLKAGGLFFPTYLVSPVGGVLTAIFKMKNFFQYFLPRKK